MSVYRIDKSKNDKGCYTCIKRNNVLNPSELISDEIVEGYKQEVHWNNENKSYEVVGDKTKILG